MQNRRPRTGQNTTINPHGETVLDCDYLDVTRIASITGTHRNTVRGWIRSGRLPAVRLGERLLRVRRSDLDAFVTDYSPEVSGWLSAQLGR